MPRPCTWYPARRSELYAATTPSAVFVTQNLTTADVIGRPTINLLARSAEFVRSMIAERTHGRIAASRREETSTRAGALGLLGERQKLFVNEVEARVVHEAFTHFR
jgi:DNA invertase Pin-like site-specific DNA recombinase